MNGKTARIDLVKLLFYILKRVWLLILCAAIGAGFMYWRTAYRMKDTYTASGTMYVYNANPNLVNYGYTNTSDLSSAVKLLDTYMVVVRSNKVMDVVVERLLPEYPTITAAAIAGSLSMGSVSDTGVLRVRCTTDNPQKSADICNAVLDVAPAEIIRVVSAGDIEIIDYASPPISPDGRGTMRKAMIGALAGGVVAGSILALLFLLNQKVDDTKELTDNYTRPVLSSIKRDKEENEDPGKFMLNKNSPMDVIESYAKLRMNLMYTLVDKEKHTVIVTSAISGEGKSTIAANLAISVAMSGKRVLLVDADMRRACQHDLFHYDDNYHGLSDVLVGARAWQDVVLSSKETALHILPAGSLPPNPAELLDSPAMHTLLTELEAAYDLVLLDAPPINIVADPLALSAWVAGGLFVVRQGYSDHRDIRRALIQAEMTGLNLLGFVFYGENLRQGGYYSRRYYYGKNGKYYGNYYKRYDSNRYDTRGKTSRESMDDQEKGKRRNGHDQTQKNKAASDPSPADGTRRTRRRS